MEEVVLTRATESVCNQQQGPVCQSYPSVMETLVNQSKINSQAYSLWLNDLKANTGSILFGGIDTSKYNGPLVTLPLQSDSQTNAITSFSVAFTGFSIGTPKGEETNFVPQNFAEAAVLDSGTSNLVCINDSAPRWINAYLPCRSFPMTWQTNSTPSSVPSMTTRIRPGLHLAT